MEGGRAGRALFKGVEFQLAGFDAAEKFKFNDLLGDNGAEETPFEECTHVIVSGLQYDDPVCAAARRDGKALVTKAWVTGSLGANALMDTSSVLYMPLRDPSGIPGCKSFCICLTGYQGQARREIMEMVEMMGSKFTKQLNMQLVTHLICYKFEGPKYEAAQRCKIKLVNHRWLEDCLRHWCVMDELNYTTMSGYEIEELESQLNDSQDAEPAARTPELDAELQFTKPSTKHAKDTGDGNGRCSIADHTGGGDKNVASKLRKQTVVKGTTPRMNGRHGNREWEDSTAVDCVVEEVRGSELTKQAALVRPGTKSNEVELQAQKQVATTLVTEARQSPVNSDKNRVKELQGNQFAATEASGRENIEPICQQQVPGDSKPAEPSIGAVKDNGAGSCSFKRQVSPDADTAFERRRKTLSKDKVPRSCSPKEFRIPDKTPTQKAAPTEASGREKDCCIEPIRQQQVAEYSKRAEPSIGAVKDNGAGSCSSMRQASPDADSAFDRRRKTLSKDKLPRSCSPQSRIPVQRASPTEASGREKDCIEPIRQQQVAEDSKRAEPAIGAVKDNGAGSCSFMRQASPDADSAFERKRKTLSKDKVSRSCSTKDQFRIPDKPPTQRASPTEASGREKDCCIEPIGQQQVAEDSKRAEPSTGAVKDNDAGSCSFMRHASPDAFDRREKALSKDKVPSSCSPKDQFRIPDKAPTERASLSSKKRKSSVSGSEEEETGATSSKKAKDDDSIQSSLEVVTDETETTLVQKGKRKPGGTADEASPVDGKEKSAANKGANIVVVELSDDSREDKCKRKPKCTSSKQKKRPVKTREEPKPDPKKQKIQSKKPAARKCSRSTPKRLFAIGGHRNEKQRYLKIIRQLGGECKDSHIWKEQTTHCVMPLRRTEKVFAALAAGRWILKPEYLEASDKAGSFVKEEEYEYNGPGCNQENTVDLEAPRKWRTSKELTGCGAFQGMRVIVYGECTLPRLGTLKRALKAGGGCVLAAHPPYHCYLARGIDYAICGSGTTEDDPWIVQFRKHKVACVGQEYMVNFVCKPSSSLEKHILYGTGAGEAAARARLEQIKAEMRGKNEEQEEEEEDFPCVVCKKRDSEELMLLCGDGERRGCNIAMHTFCCDPPMDKVPEGDWYCKKCSQVVVCR